MLVTVAAFMAAWAVPVWPRDEALLLAVQDWQSPLMTTALGAVSYLGCQLPGMVSGGGGLTLVSMAPLLWRRRVADAFLLSAAVSSILATLGLKALVGRPRPAYAIVEPVPQDMGFPSGHAAFAVLLGGVLIYLVWQHVEYPPLRWAVRAILDLLVLARRAFQSLPGGALAQRRAWRIPFRSVDTTSPYCLERLPGASTRPWEALKLHFPRSWYIIRKRHWNPSRIPNLT